MKKVKYYEDSERRQLEEYATNIQMKREDFATLTDSCSEFLARNNIVEICSSKDEQQHNLGTHCSDEIVEHVWSMDEAHG